jgi:exo-beta-1,3-glucanase (GH17 family)
LYILPFGFGQRRIAATFRAIGRQIEPAATPPAKGEESMKYFLQAACAAALMGLSSNSFAAVHGINYDPDHSVEWLDAQKKGNVTEMQRLFTRDLAQIKAMNFGIIKTFYSTYCAYNGCIYRVAQLAQQAGLKVMLGVYEFSTHKQEGCTSTDECEAWTKAQVLSAIDQAKNFSTTIIGIVVGNEDMFDHQGNPWYDMQERIVADIKTIRAAGVSVPVTTAQRQGDWYRLNQRDPNGVLNTVRVIGANIYPYWGKSPERKDGYSVARLIQAMAKDLLTALGPKGVTGVIITEEGWPSCYDGGAQPPANISDEIDYFSTWSKHENQTFDSYYFAAYDKRGANLFCTPSGEDADSHFGLCLASKDGPTKDLRLINCP